MRDRLPNHYDVLVIGAGPAGIAAACAAASHGAVVGLVDEQPRAGGQVWRHDVMARPARAARDGLARLARSGVEHLAQTRVLMAHARSIFVQGPDGTRTLSFGALVLATGARELLLPFPGWTLPGVTGAGGAQALVKQGWPIAGKRVLVAGSGPLLLAAAATLRRHDAHVIGILEQASRRDVLRFASHLPRWPGKLLQAFTLGAQLAGVPYRCGSVVQAAHGDNALRSVTVSTPRGEEHIDCDHLAIGYGLVPNTELAQLLGCALVQDSVHSHVAVDAAQRTSVEHVYAVGEACGIGGRDSASIEGAMAGHMAAGGTIEAVRLRARHRHARAFANVLQRHFNLHPRIHQLATPQTLVCRCEDVSLAQLQSFSSARDAKLATRCGMGACQGRICGTAMAELGLARQDTTPTHGGQRPPLFPLRLADLADVFPAESDADSSTPAQG